MVRKRHQKAWVVDGATDTTIPTTMHAGDLEKTNQISSAATAVDENNEFSPKKKTLLERFSDRVKGLLCVNFTTDDSVDASPKKNGKKKKTHFWQKRRQRKMKMIQQSEQLEELQPQNETLMQDHKTTSGAVFLTEQDVEPNGNHHQEQHNVVQQGQLLRRNQNEEEARDKDDCLQQNAIEDTKWHNKKIVAKRGLVDWLKRRQHRITVEIQQAKDFKKLSSYIVELKRQLKQGLQASEDKCELSENLMRMIEPAGKQFCLTLQQMDILSISRASQHSKCDLVTHLRVKKQESYGAQEPRRMIEAAELETTNEQKEQKQMPPMKQESIELLLKMMLIKQQEIAQLEMDAEKAELSRTNGTLSLSWEVILMLAKIFWFLFLYVFFFSYFRK